MGRLGQPAKRLKISPNTYVLTKDMIRVIADYCAYEPDTLLSIILCSKLCKQALQGITVFLSGEHDIEPEPYWNLYWDIVYIDVHDASFLSESTEIEQVIAVNKNVKDDKFNLYQSRFTEHCSKKKDFCRGYPGIFYFKDITTPYSFKFKEFVNLSGICYDLFDFKYLDLIDKPRVLPPIIDFTVKQNEKDANISSFFQSIDLSRSYHCLKNLYIKYFDFCSFMSCMFLTTLSSLVSLTMLTIDNCHFRDTSALMLITFEAFTVPNVWFNTNSFQVEGEVNLSFEDYYVHNRWPDQFRKLGEWFFHFDEFQPYELINERVFFDAFKMPSKQVKITR